MRIGYTSGVYDLFHVGHLALLRNAKGLCDRLIVGVTTDELLLEYKKKAAVIPFAERIEIVRSIRYVDTAVPQESMDKLGMWGRLKFDVMFVGDDWYDSPKWQEYDRQFADVGVQIVYFPYTRTTSSTIISTQLRDVLADGSGEGPKV